jgi:hypothetical protein
MKTLSAHQVNDANKMLVVEARGEPGVGKAYNEYRITTKNGAIQLGQISFHNGPVETAGVNGLTHEVLLAILEDRLSDFESGPYSCEENAEALDAIRKAQKALRSRTEKRLARGVEGTHTV